MNSNIEINSNGSPNLITAESVFQDTEVIFAGNMVERKLAKYIADVFNANVNFDSAVTASQFLQSRIEKTKYYSVQRKRRNIELLQNDFLEYYQGIPLNWGKEKWHFQKIMDGNNINTYEICMLAMFLDIPVQDLVEFTGVEQKEYPSNINRVIKGGVKRKDWEQIDAERLPLIKRTIQELQGDEQNRPQRVTIGSVQRRMGLNKKALMNCPMCVFEIQKYVESQEKYWAREVVWVVNKAIREDKTWHWTYITRTLNLDKKDFIACLPYIKEFADAEMDKKIQGIVQVDNEIKMGENKYEHEQ